MGCRICRGGLENFLPFDIAHTLSAGRPEWAFTNKLIRDCRTVCFGSGATVDALLSGISIRDEERIDSLPQRDDRRILLHSGRGERRRCSNDRRCGPGGAGGQEGCGAPQEAAPVS